MVLHERHIKSEVQVAVPREAIQLLDKHLGRWASSCEG